MELVEVARKHFFDPHENVTDPYAKAARALAGTPFANVRYLDETESTNEDAASLLGALGATGLTVVAEYQTRGGGRKGRTWVARPGTSLLFTTILPEPIPAGDLWIVPFWTGLAIRTALAQFGIAVELHWPNDVLIHGKKLSGILCVSRISGPQAWVACGVGINVTRPPDADFEIHPPPIFCSDVTPEEIDRAELLAKILTAFEATRDQLRTPQHVARKWEIAAGLPGMPYRLLLDDAIEPFEATAMGLATGGALVVERAGKREHINLADARALR
jgi:BirA family biotin operon repressor/biotin-[acetyl-CoA-carboxylase] ligase